MAGILQDGLQRKVEVINKYCSKLKIGGQGTLRRPCVKDEDPSLFLLHRQNPEPFPVRRGRRVPCATLMWKASGINATPSVL